MLALIAHDQKKAALLTFVGRHLEFFRRRRCVATGTTGSLLNQQWNLNVECVAHGPEGGDLVIGARVTMDQITAVIFFRDPLTAQPHEPDISALMRVCDVHDVPLATNPASAECVVRWLELQPSEA